MAAGAAGPWRHGMAGSRGEPIDRPKPGDAESQHAPIIELSPAERAAPPAILADERTLYVSHGGEVDSTWQRTPSCTVRLNSRYGRVTRRRTESQKIRQES